MASRLCFNLGKPKLFTAQIRKPFFSASSLPSSAPGVHSVQFGAKNLSSRRRLLVISPHATSEQSGNVQEDEVVDSNVLPYCSLDQKKKKSLGEMEQEFLQALQAFYYEGKSIMSNEEFDNLKEELVWEGSSVVMLSADEQRFLEASMAYVSGNPILSDKEYDKLKQQLKIDGSEIVVEGPRCSLRSKKVYSDLSVDYLKMFLLNVPAAVVALGLFFFLDDLTGFEITYLLELPEPFSFIFVWFAALPLILWLSFTITNVIIKDFLILAGPCPNCGTENTSFFGTILSVSSGGAINKVKCSNCGTDMVYDSKTRLITLPEGSENSVASIGNATIPLIPFNLPQILIDRVRGDFAWKEKEFCFKELRKVVAFLLECPQYLTPFGLVEFMAAIIPLAEELELQASLLRVQFSWLLYTFKPLLCHIFLGMFVKFLDSFEGQEFEVASRLLLLSKESHHPLVFRLLALHWMLGFFALIVGENEARKRRIIDMSLRFYPTIFDSLAMKALKLDLLAYCSRLLSNLGDAYVVKDVEVDKEVYEVKLFKDGLVSVSAFKWLPPWNTETAVAFRTFHKFLVCGSPHSDSATSSIDALIDSSIFDALQTMLVESTSEFKGLVPVVVACIDRLLGCHKHRWLGEHLLKTLDKHLLPKLKKDYNLGSYFPIFERISENDKVSPSGLLNLLLRFMVFLVEKHGPDNGLRSWHHGSKILGICRTMLVHHHSSSLFTGLSHLLASICLFFPDLEVRDSARFYLRMLIGVPGKKLKHILNTGEHLPGISPSTHSGSFFNLQSPSTFPDLKKSNSIASHIHIERATSLLVKQSWSLSLPNFGINPDEPGFFGGIRDNEAAGEDQGFEITASGENISEKDLPHQQKGPLRVMDAKNSEIVNELRRHFLSIPDYRHMPGLKIKISCNLRFDSEPLVDEGEKNAATDAFDREDQLPALYAIVLKFTSSAPYGPISPFHIPFLLGSPPKNGKPSSEADSLAIVSVENGHVEEESIKAPVSIELEPREPMPGLVDVFIETNADNGQVIKGQLHSISVGIEDMFLRAIVPDDVVEGDVPNYYANLFNVLWEACETASSTGRETFALKGGKGVAAISGTRSVKLLEVPMTTLVDAVERHLSPFVVCVIGEQLVDMVKGGGVIKDVIWKDSNSDSSSDVISSPTGSRGALYLKYFGDEEDDGGTPIAASRRNVGYFHILIFLPPRFHLLFQMEIRDFSTLVRISTDHWPCLAYVDDYLEALFVD